MVGDSTIPGLSFLWGRFGSNEWRLTGVHDASNKIALEALGITRKRDVAAAANAYLSVVDWKVPAEDLDTEAILRAVDDLNDELDRRGLVYRRTGPYSRRTQR